MKHIKALSLALALILTLTACSENNGNLSEVNESAQITESTQSTSTAQSTSIPEEISEPEVEKFPVVIYPNMTVKTDGELGEIAAVLGEFGRFYGTYLSMEMYQNYLFENNAEKFSEEVTVNGYTYNEMYVKVSKCGITTYSAMAEKLNSLLTENCLDETSKHIREWFRAGENDELYLRRIGAGGYLGEDYLRIDKISHPDDATIVLDITVVGEAEEWGLPEDSEEPVTVTLKRENGALKIDSFGNDKHNHLISFTLSFVRYKNAFFILDNRTEFSKNYELEHADDTNKYYRPLNETEEMLKLLEDNAKPGEAPAESSALYLDSLEYPDENTIRLTVSSRDAHEDGTPKKASATFTRTAEGLQLAAYHEPILNWFANYKEIFISE